MGKFPESVWCSLNFQITERRKREKKREKSGRKREREREMRDFFLILKFSKNKNKNNIFFNYLIILYIKKLFIYKFKIN